MNAVIAMLAILIGWSLVAGRLERWNVTPALAMVIAGIVLTAGSEPFVEVDVDNVISERVVEITLALILFIDATESPAGVLGREPRLTVRLLAGARGLEWARAQRMDAAGRAAAGRARAAADGLHARARARRQRLRRRLRLRCRVRFLARHFPHDALQLTEDVGTLMSLAVWFVFGQVVDQALRAGIPLEIIVYALLALTVVRIVPIVLSLVGTDVSRRDAVALGWLGSRGLASIVFGTLAYIELQEPASVVVVEAMVVTVLASVVLHGFSAAPIAAAYGARTDRASPHRSPARGSTNATNSSTIAREGPTLERITCHSRRAGRRSHVDRRRGARPRPRPPRRRAT